MVGKQGYYDDKEEGLYFLRARYYDPASGRFLSVDPKGFGAGDAHLYRYGFNDPVNRTDPGGTDCEWYDVGCQAQAALAAVAGAIAQGAQAVGGWIWQETRDAEDLLRQAGAAAVTAVVKFSADAAGTVKWIEDQSGKAWAYVGDKLIEASKAAAQAFADALKHFTEPIARLWKLFDDFRRLFGEAGDLTGEVVQHPDRIADNLLRGLQKGVKDFFNPNDLFTHLKAALFQWLFGKELVGKADQLIEKIPKELTGESLLGFVIDLATDVFELSWDDLLKDVKDVIREKLGIDVDEVARRIQQVEAIWGLFHDDAGNLDLAGGVHQLYERAAEAFDPDRLLDTLKDKGLEWVKNTVAVQVPDWLADLALPGAAILDLIYKGVTWLVNNGEKVEKFLEQFLATAKQLLEADEATAAQKVVTLLENAIPLALDAVAAALGLDGVVQFIHDASADLAGIVRGWIKAALGFLIDKIKEQLKRLFGAGSKELTEKVAPEGDASSEVRVWVEERGGKAVVMTNPETQPLRERLNALDRGQLSEEQRAALDDALRRIDQVEAAGDAVIEARNTAPMDAMGMGGMGGSGMDSQQLTDMLPELADDTKELEEAMAGGACAVGGAAASAMCLGGEAWPRLHWRIGPRMSEVRPCWALLWLPGMRVWVRPDRAGLRLYGLELDYGGGDGTEALLLRPAGWESAVEGGVVWLDLPEMGAVGWARVRSVGPCPELEEGPGPLITGWFRHRRGTVYELRVEGSDEALPITGRHPVWSVDREAWVPAVELEVGERLSGLNGPVRLESRALRSEPEPVYNLEVEGEHCFRVGEQGLLVHNASGGCDPCRQKWPSGRRGLKSVVFDTITITYRDTESDPNDPTKRIAVGMLKSVQFKKVTQFLARLKYYGSDPTREPNNTTRDWFRGDSSIGYESDAPGHILANIFGGYANVVFGNGNLFPQNEYVNENTFNYFERDKIKPEVIKPKSDVCIQIDFQIGSPGKPDRPISFDYSYWFNGVFQEKVSFPNPK